MNKNNAQSLDHSKENEEFLTDSDGSSFEGERDPDVLKIKEITESLTQGLKKDLIYYKKMRRIFSKQEEELKQRARLLKEEIEIAGNLNALKNESVQLNDKIRELKENLSGRNSRIITAEVQQSLLSSEVKVDDFMSSMKYEVDNLKESYNIKKEQLKSILSSDNKHALSHDNSFQLEKEGNSVGCRCLIY